MSSIKDAAEKVKERTEEVKKTIIEIFELMPSRPTIVLREPLIKRLIKRGLNRRTLEKKYL